MDSSVLHLQHVVDSDPSLAQLATMPPGYAAWRSTAADAWVIEEWTYSSGRSTISTDAAASGSPSMKSHFNSVLDYGNAIELKLTGSRSWALWRITRI
ncbi:hypothetical protein GCM10010259_40600 [Streptomyces daghestanicus]|uniref:Uncharacterized protein n=1 Tax=Streptomyces daghestanicus TaxID=66885 RepID=A0ABQ3Q0Z9_9ACTN|nr:hypothetical protein GCM10010259_40600 [Streptomyces daghestanicus]GHI30958.1 hypothetical protein Sdagh_26880 [Streptomyces daghestanicus]